MKVDKNTTYKVGKILKRRVVGPRNTRRREVFVDWVGWNSTYSSWIPENDLVSLDQL